MDLDIRVPIGVLFVAIGALLAIHGLSADSEATARSLGLNINLIWGGAMTAFGAAMLALAASRRL